MKKYITSKLTLVSFIAAFAFGIVIMPTNASAATAYLEASRNTISVGDTAIVAVKINSDGAVLNTVEGEVALKASTGKMTVQEFSLANSILGLWPRTPSLSKDNNTVSFVGGVAGGFSIEGATLFKIIVLATKEGTVTLSPQNISVFANDGKGTKIPVQLKGLSINVVAKKATTPVVNDWAGIVSADTTAPGDFIVVFGQDPSMFSGKKFAFFSAVDNQSGIDHYEVAENGGKPVISGSTYVPQDQSNSVKLSVVAYDKAGNKTSSTYPNQQQQAAEKGIAWPAIIAVILVVIILYFIYSKLTKKSKSNKKDAPTTL